MIVRLTCQSDDLAIHYRHNPERECPLIRKLPSIENVLSEKTGGPVRQEIPVQCISTSLHSKL
jgi:hypothetical protein